jgi:hypothetical protein
LVVEDPTLTVWRLPCTVCFAVKNNVIVQLPVAWGEQVTGALTELAARLAVPTEVSVIVPWGEGAASKPLVAEALPPSPEIVTWQLRWCVSSAEVTT